MKVNIIETQNGLEVNTDFEFKYFTVEDNINYIYMTFVLNDVEEIKYSHIKQNKISVESYFKGNMFLRINYAQSKA